MENETKNQLCDLAKKQKTMIYAIACQLALNPISKLATSDIEQILIGVIALSILVFIVVSVIRLSLRINHIAATIFLGLFSIIPLINLIVLLILNSQCTKILKKHSVPVGFFGAKQEDIQNLVVSEN